MKRITNYLIALAVAAFTFTSCEDVPSPFGEIVKPSTDVGDVIEPAGTGTEADPYNVAGVLEFISGLGSDTPSAKEVYIKGYAVELTDISAQYGNATFTMSDKEDGTANKFTVYRAKGLGNDNVTDPNFIKQGDLVVVCGKVTNYKGNTPETVQGAAYVYSVNGVGGGSTKPEPTPTGDAKGTGTQADPFNIAGAIAKCQQIGETASAESYYVKGIVTKDATVSGGFGNITLALGDTKDATDIFTAYQVAGTDGEKLADGYKVSAGAEVVVYGPLLNYKGNTPETAGKSAAQIVTIDGKKTNESAGGGETGGAKGTGTQADPYNVQAIIDYVSGLAADTDTNKDLYVKGIVTEIPNNGISTQYNNLTFYISDDTSASNKFYVFRAKGLNGGDVTENMIKVGDEVVIFGSTWVNYKGNTPETKQGAAYIVSINNGGGNTGGGTTGGSSALLTNGDFETWSNGLPTGWKSASTASSATLVQSTDAHGGSYSCNVNGNESSNKRLASQEIKLAAGTYVFSFWVKPTTSDVAQVRPGYVPVTDGSAGSYAYGDYATLAAGWQQVSYEFTLNAETTVCLVVMNPKKSNYSSGKDVLIDDATLTKK